MTATYRTIEGDVLDAICFRHYGRQAGAVEAVLQANPGLAEYGPVLPADVTIELPELTTEEPADTVRLWT